MSVIARRSSDAVISIKQDNNQHTISIFNINNSVTNLLGYNKDDILEHPLNSILTYETADIINNYLEYTPDGIDLTDIISKIKNFSFINKNQEIINVQPKIFRILSNNNIINYELLIRNISITQQLNLFRKKQLINDVYTIDQNFGVLDVNSTTQEIQIISEFIKQNNLESIIGIISLDLKHDNEHIIKLSKVLVDTLHINIRYSDIIGYMGNYKFIFVLLGCSNKDAQSAISRIHKNIAIKLANYTPIVRSLIKYLEINNEANYKSIIKNINNAFINSVK
ncbi:GGDEF domain-containing protein [Neoehrlichia mikurensis]|uniref:GGDEF domain-containing protein n=1 Tax=Neoehrlichia mikurensis TaxID=89586 RepID=A0ABY5EZE6_9RICK|nr:GGDEF domain-containing protein [Neoehrlichia mikurensis]QXK91749.1 GGDEF domain-containing protein [Neoehrlichia mikurensis]UTO56528.1 GGDEF domain-containing protein [Neoehrlichia mikurensis]